MNINKNDNRLHSLRGGSWYYDAFNCRSADRDRRDAGWRVSYIGFRVVASVLS
jgi:formylglycine-generating enzyme required for sulfatase activity